MAALGAFNLLSGDQNRATILVGSLTMWLYLPIYPVLLVAALARRWRLSGAAGIVALCHLVWVIPSFAGGEGIPAAARRSPRFTMVSANVFFRNTESRHLVGELKEAAPDVLNLQEVTDAFVRELRDAGLFKRYPYRLITTDAGAGGTAILSRFPLTETATLDVMNSKMVRATVRIGTKAVRLVAVHPLAPKRYHVWKAQRDALHRVLVEERTRYPSMVVAGDFNSTQFNSWLDDLETLGFRSAHELRGRGYATTWPNGRERFPPIRIDHVLVSKPVVPLFIREGRGQGSDHRPLMTELAVL